ncbi:hypothetical protein [Mesorhizobium sp. M0227]|uniref:hypothetical protein n=1 Tax=unclassified Mesorhizobium TaxID=325217 RepID=UPI00333623D5
MATRLRISISRGVKGGGGASAGLPRPGLSVEGRARPVGAGADTSSRMRRAMKGSIGAPPRMVLRIESESSMSSRSFRR